MAYTFPSSPADGDIFEQYKWNATDSVWNLNLPETMPNDIAASGGTEVTSGGYKYHTFTASDNFTVSAPGTCDVLIVSGGGAGGAVGSDRGAGGGGAGSVRLIQNVYFDTGSTFITVGAGGAGVSPTSAGSPGNYSDVNGIREPGGGGGGRDGFVAPSGACSGGNGDRQSQAPTALPGYGFRGGTTSGLDPDSGAGGGGMGAVGASVGSGQGGAGGAGINTYSAWATATSTGDSGYYGGGGGGRGESSIGSGGIGGGGAGASSGSANTGGGGGGNRGATSGSGGSGLVIVRYPV